MEPVSVVEAARRLGVSTEEVRKRIRNGELQSAPLPSDQGIGMGVLLPGDETAGPSSYDLGGAATPAPPFPEPPSGGTPVGPSQPPYAPAAGAPAGPPGISTCSACGGVSDSTATTCVWCGASLESVAGGPGTGPPPVEIGPSAATQPSSEHQPPPGPPPARPEAQAAGPGTEAGWLDPPPLEEIPAAFEMPAAGAAPEELPDLDSFPRCPQCGRANGPGASLCAWCGASMSADPAEFVVEAPAQEAVSVAAAPEKAGQQQPQENVPEEDLEAHQEPPDQGSTVRELVSALQTQVTAQAAELQARCREIQELHVLLQQLQRSALPAPEFPDDIVLPGEQGPGDQRSERPDEPGPEHGRGPGPGWYGPPGPGYYQQPESGYWAERGGYGYGPPGRPAPPQGRPQDPGQYGGLRGELETMRREIRDLRAPVGEQMPKSSWWQRLLGR